MSSSNRGHLGSHRTASLCDELDSIAERLTPSLASESAPRLLGLIQRFGVFARQAFGVKSLSDVTAEHVARFVHSSDAGGKAVSVATMRLRRSALRSMFRAGRELGLVDGDPTVDLVLPARASEAARPLTDLEVQRCRRAALEDLTSTRLSVPWALGEATARTSEVPHLRVRDVDVAERRLWIHGSAHTESRWGRLTCWGAAQLERHLRDHGEDLDARLTDSFTTSAEGGSYSSYAIREVLRRAGLHGNVGVHPASLAGWAGVQAFNEHGRIEEAARALGMRSLDRAARLLGWDWAEDTSVEVPY